MKRRTFVAYSSILSIAASIPFYNCNSISKELEIISSPLTLKNILTHNEIISIGKKYLINTNKEYDQNELILLVLKKYYLSKNKLSIENYIKKQIADDFVDDKVLIIDCWILSLTEVLQCTIYSKLYF